MKKITASIVFAITFLLILSCSAKGASQAAPAYREMSASDDAVSTTSYSRASAATPRERDVKIFEEAPPDAEQYSAPQFTPEQRKLVKKANLRIRVEDIAAADKSISALMEQHGAYAASSETSDDSRRYVIRVPQRNYEALLAGVNGMGKTLYRSESAEDVTLRYYDLEGRLATKKELLKTYQSYLGKAKNIEEILSVEARIADLQSEIDQTGKDLRYLANLVDYSTISLDIFGPVASSPYRGPTLGERITELFSGFGEFASILFTVVTGIIIYGIPILLLLALLFLICFGRIGLLKKLWRVIKGKK